MFSIRSRHSASVLQYHFTLSVVMTITIFAVDFAGNVTPVDIGLETTVADVKQQIYDGETDDTLSDLIYCGEVLPDNNPLMEFGTAQGDEIEVMPTRKCIALKELRSKGKDATIANLISEIGNDGELITSYLDAGIAINGVDKQGKTALIAACESASIDVVKLLLSRGADVNPEPVRYVLPPLLCAVLTDDSRRIELLNLLISKGSNLDITDTFGGTALHYASVERSFDVIKLLLDNGANPSTRDNDGCTPLHYAAYYSCIRCVKALVSRSRKGLTICDSNGNTPLHVAASSEGLCQFEIVEYFILMGSDHSKRNKCGLSPIMLSISQAAPSIISYLLRCSGTNINTQFYNGWYPIHYAIKRGDSRIVNILISAGADVNVINKRGDTPLDMLLKKRAVLTFA